ncbi:acyltransferase [Peribacillus simplex]|uniref:acyltransferase family protein n=1 Tax=Peribacillus simplex TaxID=1478 RepID=UPI00339593B9
MGRLKELDSLRGIAALAVVFYHYTTRYEELFGHKKDSYLEFNYGDLGVNLFFIISGFVIFMTIINTNTVRDFAQKRAIRLYPAYISAVVITFLMVRLYGLEGRGVSSFEALFNITMLQGFVPIINHVDGAYWSLTVELTFYILIGIILYLGRIKNVFALSILWLISSFIIQVANIVSNDHIITKALVYYSIADYSHLFIAGIMFYYIKVNPHLKYYVMLISCLIYQFAISDILTSTITVVFFLIFYLLIKNKLTFLNFKPLTFLGTISYSLYLIHQNIGYIVIDIMENHNLINEVYLIIPVSISIVLATLITYYIEKPTISIFKKQMKKRKIMKLEKEELSAKAL